MKISTTTSYSLTEVEMKEAIKLFLQAKGHDLEGKDVAFVSKHPLEIVVHATESSEHRGKDQRTNLFLEPRNDDNNENWIEGNPFSKSVMKAEIESEKLVTQQPALNVKRPFNPFADSEEGVQVADSRNSENGESGKPIARAVVTPKFGRGIFG